MAGKIDYSSKLGPPVCREFKIAFKQTQFGIILTMASTLTIIALASKLQAQTIESISQTIRETFPTTDKLDYKNRSQFANNTFFVKTNSRKDICAVGRLRPIEIELKEPGRKIKNFLIEGIADIVVPPKFREQRHGSELMKTIFKYLNKKNKLGIGFCNPSLIPFYEKCGFLVTKNAHEVFFPGVSIVYNDPKNQSIKLDAKVDAAFYSNHAKPLIKMMLRNSRSIVNVSFVLDSGNRAQCKHW